MADRPYKIKGINDDDELLYIGSLFRHSYSTDWHLQVRFKKSDKRSVLASLIPDLVVGRTYNTTGEITVTEQSEQFTWSKIVGNRSGIQLNLESVAGVNRYERYFLLKNGDEYLAFPQLELARVLFIQNSKMFHYTLEPIALGIDFQYYQPSKDILIIEVCDSAQLSKSQFERLFNPNKFAYTLRDTEGNNSFLSINKSFLENRRDYKDEDGRLSTWWKFSFSAPKLKGSVLTISTHESTGIHNLKKVRVVTEIQSITNVPHSLPQDITYISKKWLKTSVANVSDNDNSSGITTPDYYEIDDQQSASSFLPEKIVRSHGNNEFSLEPKRQAKTLTAKSKLKLIAKDVDGSDVEISEAQIASTDLRSLLGSATPVVTSTNTSDEIDSSAFVAFESMVNIIKQHRNLELTEYSVRRLHKVGRSQNHWKKVGNRPRCAAVAHFRHAVNLSSYSLIEIDLTDFFPPRKLSTLLFKYDCLDEARLRVDPILSAFVAKSLKWPTKYFQDNHIKANFINHPQNLNVSISDSQGDLILNWAKNSVEKMRML